MLSRPLDLASRLRPAPRNFDHVFLINLGLIALFFRLFDLPYVLAPVLELGGPELPVVSHAAVGAPRATLSITVMPGGAGQPFIMVDSGVHNLTQFKVRLKEHARTEKSPVLRMFVDRRVPFGDVTDIRTAAEDAGFRVYIPVQTEAIVPAPKR